MSRIKQTVFWKRFSRILLFLLSLYIIFAAFNYDSVRVAADSQTCQSPTGSPTNLSPNGQIFPAGTRSVTLSWSPVERASFYSINVRIGSTHTVYANRNYPGTSITIDNLKDNTSYIWSIRAFNQCGSGGIAQATFSVAAPQTTTRPICTIFPQSSSGPAPLFVSFSSSVQVSWGEFVRSYAWDLNGDGQFEDAFDSSAATTYYQDTSVRLRVTDSAGNRDTCSAFVNITSTPLVCSADLLRCPDDSLVGRAPTIVVGFLPVLLRVLAGVFPARMHLPDAFIPVS
ncbi:fibronectin type III domain-containing protein [Candidatus Microgenomates bacterium]|nr:fibronectin type III domain-containing protein [Candidatus Microgenomates bacterium]